MRKWMPAALVLLGYGLSALVYRRLPEMAPLDLRPLLPPGFGGRPDLVPRGLLAIGLPTLALLVWSLMHEAPVSRLGRWSARLFPGSTPAPYDRYAPTYRLAVIWVVSVILAVHVAALGGALGWGVAAGRVVGGTLGLGLMLFGNEMPKLRQNPIAGIRTPSTMRDPLEWARVHRVFGRVWLVVGLLTVGVAVLAPRYALAAALGGVLLSALSIFAIPRPPALSVAFVFVLPLGTAQPARAQASADTVAPATAVETSVEIPSGDAILPATLTLPRDAAGPLTVALIVAGSGPTDRNGNTLGTSFRSNMLAQLAWGLAEHGLASLRYDKRGAGARSSNEDPRTLTMDLYRDDVVAAARYLRADPRFEHVVLIGHSEGAGLVAMAANAGAPADAVVMMAGTGRRLTAVLHDQLANSLDSATVAAADSAFARYLQGEDVVDAPAAIGPLVNPAIRPLMRSMAAYDPPAEVARLRKPLLIVHGGMDLQITDPDFAALTAARPDAQQLLIPAANHVFRAVSERSAPAQMPAYTDPRLPIVPELVPGLAAWIERTLHGNPL